MAALGRKQPVVPSQTFSLRQPAFLTRTAEFGQKQTFFLRTFKVSEAKVGDLVAVPSGDRVGLAKLIYVSHFFREVVLLKLYRTTFPDGVTHFASAEVAADLYYTGSAPILACRWKIVGFEPVSDAEQLLSKRTVASDIWIADKCLGKASEHDLETLPKMLTYGSKLIEKAVARLAELNHSSTT